MGSTIQVNGEREPLAVSTIAELLRGRDIEPNNKGVAVALNGKVLPRRAWADTPLDDGDSVEIAPNQTRRQFPCPLIPCGSATSRSLLGYLSAPLVIPIRR